MLIIIPIFLFFYKSEISFAYHRLRNAHILTSFITSTSLPLLFSISALSHRDGDVVCYVRRAVRSSYVFFFLPFFNNTILEIILFFRRAKRSRRVELLLLRDILDYARGRFSKNRCTKNITTIVIIIIITTTIHVYEHTRLMLMYTRAYDVSTCTY